MGAFFSLCCIGSNNSSVTSVHDLLSRHTKIGPMNTIVLSFDNTRTQERFLSAHAAVAEVR